MKNHDQPDGEKDSLPLDSSLRRSDRELEVVQILEDLDSELEQDHELSSIYQGVLRTINDKSNPDRLYQAANSIRGLMDKLPEYLNVPTTTQRGNLKDKVIDLRNQYDRVPNELKNYSNENERAGRLPKKFLKRLTDFFEWFELNNPSRRSQIEHTLKEMDIAHSGLPEPLANKEIKQWDRLRSYFIKILHYGVVANEEEFRTNLGQLERIILNKRKPQTSEDFDEIDEILKNKEVAMPSTEEVEKILELIGKRTANYDHFFSNLNSVDWLEPLKKKGFFSKPPVPIKHADSMVSFPFWPESKYLARVASKAPNQVFNILKGISETDNVRVHEDLVEIATKLPGKQIVEWVEKEISWLEQQENIPFLLPKSLSRLISYLVLQGQYEISLKLARTVLHINSVERNFGDAIGKIGVWEYGQILKNGFPLVLRYTKASGLVLLMELLEETFSGESRSGQEDYSYIWRITIESSEHFRRDDIRDALIDAIRDGSEQLVKEGEDLLMVVNMLLEREKPIFKRIVLNLLLRHYRHSKAKELVCDKENFFNVGLRYEYTKLLPVVFPELDEDEKNLILSWIEEGPQKHKNDTDTDPESLSKQKTYWQTGYLKGLRDNLPVEWKNKYDQMVRESGDSGEQEPPFHMSGWRGTTSPKDVEDLEKMNVSEIADFLRNWRPIDRHSLERPDRLGNVLQEVVSNSPDQFAVGLKSFHGIHPTYSRALIEGFKAAMIADKPIDQSAILDYLKWVVEQPRDEVEKIEDQFDSDPDWGWARNAVTDFLSVGCEKNVIDPTLRELVWDILNVVADDPSPTPEDDRTTTMEPFTQSINTTRGKALHAIMQYALWVRQGLNKGQKESEIKFDISLIPEVQQRLEKHLDPKFDPSPAIRAVFGRWYPWLVLLDRRWAKNNLDKIFTDSNRLLRYVAWNAYIQYTQVYNPAFELLREQYEITINELSKTAIEAGNNSTNTGWVESPGTKLGEHIVVLVGRGIIAWDDEDGLVKKFFENASTTDVELTIEFVGIYLKNSKGLVTNEIKERFRQLWEHIIGRFDTE